MAIGYQPGVASINSQAALLAIRWQKLAADMLQFATIAGALSHSDLVTLGFTSGDATSIAAIITDMGNYAGVYYGTRAEPGFNYYGVFRTVRGTDVA